MEKEIPSHRWNPLSQTQVEAVEPIGIIKYLCISNHMNSDEYFNIGYVMTSIGEQF